MNNITLPESTTSSTLVTSGVKKLIHSGQCRMSFVYSSRRICFDSIESLLFDMHSNIRISLAITTTSAMKLFLTRFLTFKVLGENNFPSCWGQHIRPMGHYAVKHIQVWRRNADFDEVRFLYWVRYVVLWRMGREVSLYGALLWWNISNCNSMWQYRWLERG